MSEFAVTSDGSTSMKAAFTPIPLRFSSCIGHATRPKTGESVCGDRCGWWRVDGRIVLALADGLGHGSEAARAAAAALACIGENLGESCEALFARCDERLFSTRGAALAIGIVEPASGRMSIATVGNIRALLLGEQRDLRLGGARGIVGAGYAKLVPETLMLVQGNVVLLFSDGMEEFPPLRKYFVASPISVEGLAQTILAREARGNDDAALLIYQHDPAKLELP